VDEGSIGPPPEENPPAAMAEPALAGPPRNIVPIIAGGVVAVLVVVAAIGYGIAGFTFASGRIATTRTTYNAVVAHQNTLTDEFNSLNSNVAGVNLTSATTTQLKQNRAAYDTLVSQSQSAQPTITTDDAALAAAQARLSDSSWLTLFSRPMLNNASAKIGHERKALATAKTITGDLIELGTFYQSFYDSLIDLDTLSTKAQATDFTGAATAITALKTDIAKAIKLSDAPGIPPEMKQFLTDFQTLAVDFGKLLDAAVAGDTNGAQADLKAVDADITKIEAYDTDKMSTEIKAFYQPMIDAFNSEIAKANSM
jgi:hypothetical protein